MRLALAAAALLLTAEPNRAAVPEPPAPVKVVIDVGVVGGFLEANCPRYRINLYEYEKLARTLKVELSDLTVAYKDYFDQQNAFMRNRTDMTKEELCNYFADSFGEHGRVPNLIVRK